MRACLACPVPPRIAHRTFCPFMRHSAAAQSLPNPATPGAARTDWQTLGKLLPYLWQYRWRVGLALGFLLAAKGRQRQRAVAAEAPGRCARPPAR